MTVMQGQETTASDPENLSHDDANEQTMIPKPKRTPLPKISLLIIFLIQFSEPITGTVIYPFINRFVRDTGVTGGDERKTGYFAGLIVSLAWVYRLPHLRIDLFRRNRCSSLLNPSPFSTGERPQTDLGESLYYCSGHLACPS